MGYAPLSSTLKHLVPTTQRCNKVMKGENFHLGTAMHRSWRTLMQIGVATWRSIWKSPQSAIQCTVAFKDTWITTKAFCLFDDKLVWNFLPEDAFLPQDLASRPSRTQAIRHQIRCPVSPSPSRTSMEEEQILAAGDLSERISGDHINLADPFQEWPEDSSKGETPLSSHPTIASSQDRRRLASQQAGIILRTILQELTQEDD